MSRNNIKLMVEMSECPRCAEAISIRWSCCYDPECCGIDDRIECEACDWEVEGYFEDLDVQEFKKLVPRKADEDKSQYKRLQVELADSRRANLSSADLKWQIKTLKDRIAQLQSEIKIFEQRFGRL